MKDLKNKTANITLGATFTQKYISNRHNKKCTEIKAKKGFVKSYEIENLHNQQLYKAKLNVLEDNRAILSVNYTTYSNVKNKYETYFNKEGKEIIDNGNSTAKEKKYFDSL